MKKLLFIFIFGLVVSLQANVEISNQGGVLVLKINDLPRNTVSIKILSQIDDALESSKNDKSIGSIVITGSKNVFSSGAGAESLQKIKKDDMTHSAFAHKVFKKIESFPKPIIAAVNGISAGGGNELALACDIRIASKSAKFRQHELQAGLIPGFGGMQRLPRLIGYSRALELILTGRFVNANEALNIGLVSKVVEDSKVLEEAIKLGNTLNVNLDKKALAVFKKRMSKSYNETFYQALENDQIAFDKLATSPEIKKAIAKFIKRQK